METKRYWQRIEDLKQDPDLQAALENEGRDIPVEDILDEDGSLKASRRDFLKFFGFSVSAVTLAACNQTPVKYALPYVQAPTDMIPSIPNYYASTFYDGQEAIHVLVKTRDGRPIKIEANPESPLYGHGNGVTGGVHARGIASILGLYDNTRLKHRVKKQGDNWVQLNWEKADQEIVAGLSQAAAQGKTIAVVSGSIVSPTLANAVAAFAQKFPGTRLVTYDAVSASAIAAANDSSFGKAVIPSYRFDQATAVVGIGADFLGGWLASTHYNRDWARRRRVRKDDADMSRHYQFETALSITGANADYRHPIKPSQEGLVALNLYNALAAKAGRATYAVEKFEVAGNGIAAAANDLWANRGKALVVAGSNDPNLQVIVNQINDLLGSYGATIDLDRPLMTHQGREAELATLVADMAAGRVGAVVFHNTNPAYTWPDSKAFADALARVPLRVSLAEREDETAALCQYIVPDSHYLESWGDAEPVAGMLSVVQPAITPLFETRPAVSTFAAWAGQPSDDQYALVKSFWQDNVAPGGDFESFWQSTVHMGFATDGKSALAAQLARIPKIQTPAAGRITADAAANALRRTAGEGLELTLYEKHAIGDGSMAYLPWLQELPDSITRAAWDNYVLVNPRYAEANGIETEDVLRVEVPGQPALELPAVVNPGQARDTFAIALGYGRTKGGKAAIGVGQNAYPLASLRDGFLQYQAAGVKVTKTGGRYDLAFAQISMTEANRPIVKETTLAAYRQDPYAGNKERVHLVSLWEGHSKKGHYWAMAIDLNACTGCGACVVSCQSENNIPVVGKAETRRGRQMHWIRIDRYYSSAVDNGGLMDSLEAAENPQVAFQPMLCQHCDNAPCETVCPVLATTHSSEGLNQMTYNRCIGTRYCANNCPYKVRRFNWFDYFHQDNRGRSRGKLTLNEEIMGEAFEYNPVDDLGRMVLNPDVTVRSRGVMEKCTFCVQRLQAAKVEAKKEGRRVTDAEVQPACAQVCPSGAIVFGDLNDPNSLIAKHYNTERSYHVLEDIKTLPHISYQVKVRNTDEQVPA